MYYKKMLTGVNAYYSEGKNRGDKFPKIPYENGGEDPKYYIALDKAISISERINIIVNKWGKCRLHIDNTGLQKILKIFQEKYNKMSRWDIIQVSLWDNHEEIVELFKLFMKNLKSTGSSKALHILNPSFFAMWDDAIRRKGYGCSETEEGYFNFLLRSQKEIKEILETYVNDYGKSNNTSKELSQRIYSPYKGHTKTLLKLLDEYNWVTYTKTEWK
jgi:hypothetical protein